MMDIIWDMVWAARMNVYFALISIPLGFVLAIGPAIALAGPRAFCARSARLMSISFGVHRCLFSYFLPIPYSAPLACQPIACPPILAPFGTKVFCLSPGCFVLRAVCFAAEHGGLYGRYPEKRPARRSEGGGEAADAFGFSPVKKFWRVTWPAAIRIAWPSYTNEMVFLFLSTALVYTTIPVLRRAGGADYKDMLAIAIDTAKATFNPYISYLPAMILTQILFF